MIWSLCQSPESRAQLTSACEKVADELEAAGRAAWARPEKGDCLFRELLIRMCGGLSQLLGPYNTVLRLRCRFQEFKTQYDEEIAHIQVREFSS